MKKLISVIIGVLLLAGVPAAAETTQTAGRASTVVTVNADAAVALEFFDIRVSALWPATGSTPVFTFPRAGGQLIGGLQFTANDKCFTAYAPEVRGNTVKVWINARTRIDLFTIDSGNLVLTAAGAQALNDGLGFIGLFSQGFLFGTVA